MWQVELSEKEAKNVAELAAKIIEVIESEGEYTYREVMHVMKGLMENYEKKGCDLLNNKSIKEVATF